MALVFHDEVELEDFEWDEEEQGHFYKTFRFVIIAVVKK